jgi:hypothetical protein
MAGGALDSTGMFIPLGAGAGLGWGRDFK